MRARKCAKCGRTATWEVTFKGKPLLLCSYHSPYYIDMPRHRIVY